MADSATFYLPRLTKWVPGTSVDLVFKSKMSVWLNCPCNLEENKPYPKRVATEF